MGLKVKLVERDGTPHEVEIPSIPKDWSINPYMIGPIIRQDTRMDKPVRVFRFGEMPMLQGSMLVFYEVDPVFLDGSIGF